MQFVTPTSETGSLGCKIILFFYCSSSTICYFFFLVFSFFCLLIAHLDKSQSVVVSREVSLLYTCLWAYCTPPSVHRTFFIVHVSGTSSSSGYTSHSGHTDLVSLSAPSSFSVTVSSLTLDQIRPGMSGITSEVQSTTYITFR